jgi:hypothetical protein
MFKYIKNNKVSTLITIVICIIIYLSSNKENFSSKKKMKVYPRLRAYFNLSPASRDPQEDIIEIEREHKCNQAGCATRETKQKKHILL